jgi:FixJ family two-component response regulator
MTSAETPMVFIIDDDADVRESIPALRKIKNSSKRASRRALVCPSW